MRTRTDHTDDLEKEEIFVKNAHDSSACQLKSGFTSSDNCVFNVQKPGVPDYLGGRKARVDTARGVISR